MGQTQSILSVGFFSPDSPSDLTELDWVIFIPCCKACCLSPGPLFQAANRVQIGHLLLVTFNTGWMATCLYKSIRCLPTSLGTFLLGQLRSYEEQQLTGEIIFEPQNKTQNLLSCQLSLRCLMSPLPLKNSWRHVWSYWRLHRAGQGTSPVPVLAIQRRQIHLSWSGFF